ncbi:MAG: DUF177 domain-containing protein [Verrucomicrobia bacterium]|nr:DUF177 domain-containing protein [Verrucomicrobiota bacterium]MBU4290746.1 DUF177 domain-containing protein [Verrucomicrobiota bacterium]MBU4428679.1 DUF177 domain-containing protein [Verrucomicrobiota bacterium]MCG2679764.1 DUF177 domain-containing protein [Kiritimatiellia bacterium]
MIIETGDLQQKDRRYTGEEPASILDIEHDQFVRGWGSITYDLTTQRLNEDLLVQGTLTADMECQCARCAEWSKNSLRVAGFVRSYSLSSANESIDLTDDIREDILLALPMKVVCSDTCRGLCPGCGVNLNKKPCACHPGKSPTAWHVLDQLPLI